MMQVNIPQKKQNDSLSKAMSIGQIIAGLMIPGGQMMAVNGAAGLVGSVRNNQAGPQPLESSAMSRRANLKGVSREENLMALRDGEQALNELPHEVRLEYGKPLFQMIQAGYKDYKGMA